MHPGRVSASSLKVPLYVVVRVDRPVEDLDPDVLRAEITLVEAFPDQAEAVREVERLSELNASKGCVYFWTATRFYPEGRNVEVKY